MKFNCKPADRWIYYMYILLTKHKVKMAGYWPSSLWFYQRNLVLSKELIKVEVPP